MLSASPTLESLPVIRLETAAPADAEALVSIQKAAFRRLYDIYEDEQSPYLRGTEEFDRWFDRGHGVYKIFADGMLAGGLTVFQSRTDAHEYYLARIYVAPEFQRRGIAKGAIKLCEKLYPDAKRWFLDYPEDQIANRRYYENCGYLRPASHPHHRMTAPRHQPRLSHPSMISSLNS